MEGTSEGLRRIAGALRLEADRVRLQAVRVRAAGAVRWRSPAAELFRAQVDARARSLVTVAEQGWEAAHAAELLATALEADAAEADAAARVNEHDD